MTPDQIARRAPRRSGRRGLYEEQSRYRRSSATPDHTVRQRMGQLILQMLRRSHGMTSNSIAAFFPKAPLHDVRRWLFENRDLVYVGTDGLWATRE